VWSPGLLEVFGLMPDDLERFTADELGRLREYVRERNRAIERQNSRVRRR